MLLSDAPPIKNLLEYYNQHIFARNEKQPVLQPAGRIDVLEEDFQDLMRAFTTVQVADKSDCDTEITSSRVGTAPVSQRSSTPSSAASNLNVDREGNDSIADHPSRPAKGVSRQHDEIEEEDTRQKRVVRPRQKK